MHSDFRGSQVVVVVVILFVPRRIYNSVADFNPSRVGVGCMSDVYMLDVPVPFSRWDDFLKL